MKIAAYEECKFAMAQLLRTMEAVAPKDSREIHDQIRNAQTRLAEDRFNLAVVGRFSRGKSSLMNAMLHTDRLPMGVEPLTSVITSVSYGTKEQVLIYHEGWSFPHETTIESLPQYVTQHGNPGNEQKVQLAQIQMPAELLRKGFYFIDTPGLGSPIMENTETTRSFLPEIDAMILVSGFDDPIDDEEAQALDSAKRAGRQAFVVLNKQDLVSEAERDRICQQATVRLRTRFPQNTPEIFALSALRAMEANAANDTEAFERSNVPVFQQAIVDFLMERKSMLILQQMHQRLSDIRNSCKEIADTAEISSGMAAVKTMVEEFARRSEAAEAREGEEWNEGRPQVRGTCKICDTMYRKVTDFLRHYQYELVIWSTTQQEHAKAGGLCPLHSWQYESIASPQGVAASQPPLLNRLAEELHTLDLKNPNAAADAIEKLLPTASTCPMCRVMYQAEDEALAVVSNGLDADPGKESSEVCFRHVGAVLRRLRSPEAASTLVQRTAQLLHRTAEDMARFAIKHEGIRRYLATEDEKRAYLRALFLLAGPRALATPVQVTYIA